jgi:membrane peptidoglycan carboxypeptidase
MAGAYATFAASGKQREPFSVKKVTSENGTIFTHRTETEQAFTAQVADNVTDVLKTVVEEGTGTNAQLPGREVAGKTGTTDGNKSAWFVGYTPQLATAISMFRYPDDESIKNRQFLEMFGTGGKKEIHGASFPSEIWADYMGKALKGEPVLKFPTPEPIGVIVNDTPPPTPVTTPTETEEATPSSSPTPTETETTPTPTESETCKPSDFNCGEEEETGGTGSGGADTGGTDGGVTSSPAPTESGDPETSRGNDNGGGLFGGPAD